MNDEIRNQFPFLKRKYGGKPLAYLDNASTTQKPQVVIDAIGDVYKNHYANIHRGVYDLSVEATEAYEGVRAKVAKFIGAKDSAEVIFTRNTTEGMNLLAYCLIQGPSLRGARGRTLPDDEILLTEMEHHSNIVPWQLAVERLKTNAKRRIKIRYLPIDEEGRLRMDLLPKYVSKKTKIVSITLMSNVLGTINDIKRIALSVKRLAPGAILIVDAAQAVGHMKINVGDLGCDFLAFSAHKMYGPSGVGVLWGKRGLLEEMAPFMGGGDMILSVGFDKTTFNEVPWKFEAGTPNIADVIAFGAAVDFIQKIGIDKIAAHEMKLTKLALARLIIEQNVEIFGSLDVGGRGPVISFNVDSIHPHDVASILNEEAVAIRSGHHCAQPLVSVLGAGAVCRVSFGVYNTQDDVTRFFAGMNKVKDVFDLPIMSADEQLMPQEV